MNLKGNESILKFNIDMSKRRGKTYYRFSKRVGQQ